MFRAGFDLQPSARADESWVGFVASPPQHGGARARSQDGPAARRALDGILIETTGLADPGASERDLADLGGPGRTRGWLEDEEPSCVAIESVSPYVEGGPGLILPDRVYSYSVRSCVP